MNLVAYRGCSAHFDIQVDDADSQPVNLTDRELEFRAKRFTSDPDPALIVKTTGAGITNSDQDTNPGQALLELDPADTADIAPGFSRLQYQVNLIDGSEKFEVQAGNVILRESV